MEEYLYPMQINLRLMTKLLRLEPCEQISTH
jgi:hypothetical protein